MLVDWIQTTHWLKEWILTHYIQKSVWAKGTKYTGVVPSYNIFSKNVTQELKYEGTSSCMSLIAERHWKDKVMWDGDGTGEIGLWSFHPNISPLGVGGSRQLLRSSLQVAKIVEELLVHLSWEESCWVWSLGEEMSHWWGKERPCSWQRISQSPCWFCKIYH